MKIGILTSGGDTPGMNAVIRAAFIKCKILNYELIGFSNGWKGLMENTTISIPDDIIDKIDLGGTILGSGRTNPLKNENGTDLIRNTIHINSLDCVIAIGGEDTLGVANILQSQGIPMIGIPKTIDNDLYGTDYTFGFNTAVTIATEALDRLKTTAKSHNRVMVVEIMGRHAGWLTMHSGIAGGAHVILIPEFGISNEQICEIIKKRYAEGNQWALVAVSEGFGVIKESDLQQEKDEFGHILLDKLGIGKKIAKMIEEKTGYTTRATVLGHTQRGGPPTAFDRVLSTQLGLKAIELADKRDFGKMPSLSGSKIIAIQLSDAVAKLKTVDEESWVIAKNLMDV